MRKQSLINSDTYDTNLLLKNVKQEFRLFAKNKFIAISWHYFLSKGVCKSWSDSKMAPRNIFKEIEIKNWRIMFWSI